MVLLLLLGLEVLLSLVLSVVGVALLLAILPILRVSLLLLVVLALATVLVVPTVLLVLVVTTLVATVWLARHKGARARLERLRSRGEGGRIVEVHALRLLRETLLLLLPVVGHGDDDAFFESRAGFVGGLGGVVGYALMAAKRSTCEKVQVTRVQMRKERPCRWRGGPGAT